MSSLYRLATGALLEATSRKVVTASFCHSAVSFATTLSVGPFESPNVPQIFDIFDAPMKLQERHHPNDSFKALNTLTTVRVTPMADRSRSRSICSDASDLPWSLPPPVTFDGPARPPHMSPSTLKNRRLQRRNLTPRVVHRSSAVSCSALTSQSETLCQLFDGPSRLTRFQYPTSQNERYSLTYVSLGLCLSTAFGWLALKDELEQRCSNKA